MNRAESCCAHCGVEFSVDIPSADIQVLSGLLSVYAAAHDHQRNRIVDLADADGVVRSHHLNIGYCINQLGAEDIS